MNIRMLMLSLMLFSFSASIAMTLYDAMNIDEYVSGWPTFLQNLISSLFVSSFSALTFQAILFSLKPSTAAKVKR